MATIYKQYFKFPSWVSKPLIELIFKMQILENTLFVNAYMVTKVPWK